MKTYCKLVDFHCDLHKDDWECHSQLQVVLQWWQGKTVAYKEAKEIGWVIGKEKDVCPYCKQFLNKKHGGKGD